MSILFNRKAKAFFNLPDRQIFAEGLRMSFEFTKSISEDANRGLFRVYNLSRNTRSLVETAVRAGIEAGYQDLSKSVEGAVTAFSHEKTEQGDTITQIEIMDGVDQNQTEINETFAPGTSWRDIFSTLITRIGSDPAGFLTEAVGGDLDDTVDNGLTISGNGIDELNNLAKSRNIEWFRDDGIIKAMKGGGSLLEEVVVLSEITGLLGVPHKTEDGLKVVSLLNTKINPGRQLDINSKEFAGLVVVESVKHIGDTHERPWFSEVEARFL